MTKLATIQKIHSIRKHPNEDVEKLEVAKIKEWPVVIPKGGFKEGDLVVFIQIDSIVPKENPYFSFMERQKYRVWSAKFKGAPSQGLVCPLTILEDKVASKPVSDLVPDIKFYLVNEGDDVTEVLGIKKYEKPMDSSICGDAKGGFPTHLISITDEDNLLSHPEVLEELKNERCYITLKDDGSSMTVIHNEGVVSVCSRRLEQKEGTGLWIIADSYGLPDKLIAYKKNIAIQGEACGGKIQGNPMGLRRPSMFVFNIKDVSTGKWYGWNEIKEVCKDLDIKPVSVIYEDFVFDENWTIELLQSIANGVKYTTDNGEVRNAEGIVLRTMTPKFSPTLGKYLSVKILNQEYK